MSAIPVVSESLAEHPSAPQHMAGALNFPWPCPLPKWERTGGMWQTVLGSGILERGVE